MIERTDNFSSSRLLNFGVHAIFLTKVNIQISLMPLWLFTIQPHKLRVPFGVYIAQNFAVKRYAVEQLEFYKYNSISRRIYI